MYAGLIDTARHTFQASGSLWQDALVMQDVESQSLWSQITGECISGPLAGKRLTLFPAFHTTYQEFKKLYPNGLLLEKPDKGAQSSHYESYFADREKLGIFGRANTFEKLPAKSKVFGLRLEGNEVAIAEEYLQKKGFAIISTATGSVIITYDHKSKTAAAFSVPQIEKTALDSLKVDGKSISLPDLGFSWETFTGKAISGNTKDLPQVPVITAFWFAWVSFFPTTELVK